MEGIHGKVVSTDNFNCLGMTADRLIKLITPDGSIAYAGVNNVMAYSVPVPVQTILFENGFQKVNCVRGGDPGKCNTAGNPLGACPYYGRQDVERNVQG